MSIKQLKRILDSIDDDNGRVVLNSPYTSMDLENSDIKTDGTNIIVELDMDMLNDLGE